MNEQKNIFDSAVLLSLTVHVVGNNAKGDRAGVEVDADKEHLRLSKQLLDCQEYEAVRDAAAKIRDMVKRKCFRRESKVFTGMDGRAGWHHWPTPTASPADDGLPRRGELPVLDNGKRLAAISEVQGLHLSKNVLTEPSLFPVE
jgi:hypothetical protein